MFLSFILLLIKQNLLFQMTENVWQSRHFPTPVHQHCVGPHCCWQNGWRGPAFAGFEAKKAAKRKKKKNQQEELSVAENAVGAVEERQ
jgi:hypothetical protein